MVLFAVVTLRAASAQDLVQGAQGSNDEEKAAWVFEEALRLSSTERVEAELEALLGRWPQTAAARDARLWLLEDAVVGGRWDRAALLATGAPGQQDSSGAWTYLSALSQYVADYSFADSSLEITSGASVPPWSHLISWILARRALGLEPEGDALRDYLALEGKAREEGWLGLWLAGLAESPENSPAWQAFLEAWEGAGEGVLGTPTGRWIHEIAERKGEGVQ